MERVDDLGDPRLSDYRDLKDRERHRARDVFIAEGRFVVRRLVETRRFRVRSLLLTESALESLRDVLDHLDDPPRLFVAPSPVVRRVVGYDFHRGCLAVAERGPDVDAGSLLAPPGARTLVLLEDLTDPDNVGAVFRNALAFGADAALLSSRCADPLYRKAIRTSSAATLTVPFARLDDWWAGLARIRQAGYRLIGLTPEESAIDVDNLDISPGRSALVLGAEGAGLTAETRAAIDLALRIPMAPGVDSLNVATAGAIALHRLHGGRRFPAAPIP
ncbi:MAG: rRNA methyltransferase [Candidatus Rokuibacteriota bacterium]|nr:MAG: rRNA methyltransferase [Candidatus Rokubacteria bacterium]